MAHLNFQEKSTIEKLLGMQSGYVSNFSNGTLQLFIGDFNLDIYDDKYSENGDSKANRLRTVLHKENDYTVSAILESLLNYQMAVDTDNLGRGENLDSAKEILYTNTRRIIERLKTSAPVENIAAIRRVDGDQNFILLAESVRRSIEESKPVEALDRLHTYMVRYSRKLCERHGVEFDSTIPLNGLFGSYIRKLRETNHIESGMTVQILGSYVKILDEYNNVRNNQSYAHDNSFINDDEALLILNSVANLVRFVDSLERKIELVSSAADNTEDRLPF